MQSITRKPVTLQVVGLSKTSTGGVSSFVGGSGGSVAVLDTERTTGKKGHELSPLQRRARALSYSKVLADQLAKVTKSEVMRRSYLRTRDQCGSIIEQIPGEGLKSYHCKSRHCLSCSRARTARMIDAYFPTISKWIENGEAYHVVLTVKNVSENLLRPTLQMMHKEYALCIRALRRKLGGEVQAMRSTECTVNLTGDVPMYHPHLHILLRGKEHAELLVDEWLRRHPDTAVRSAQNVTKATGIGSAKELLKYATKTLDSKKGEDGTRLIVPPPCLDAVFCSMRGLRLFQASQIEPAVAVQDEELEEGEIVYDKVTAITKNPNEYCVWTWNSFVYDWVCGATGETLSDYEPSRHTLSVIRQFTEWDVGKGCSSHNP